MQNINWDKLKPYLGDSRKSFEELCYQIVSEEFREKIEKGAVLTPIDDSGGGDGVEFYLTLPNGDVYGWQAKLFCRLSKGGRKEQIKRSLQTAYKNHPNLKKWFLCNKCNFTKDEKLWFEGNLPQSMKNGKRVLPKNHNVELIHWGESAFFDFLRKNEDIFKFFFSEELLSQKWFEDRFETDSNTDEIKAKYEPRLHIATEIDDTINKILSGKRLVEILDKEMEKQQVKMYSEEYKNALSKPFSEEVGDEYKNIQLEFRRFLKDKDNLIANGIQKLEELKQFIIDKNELILKTKIKELELYIENLWDFYKKYYELADSELCEPIKRLRENYEEAPLKTSAKAKTNFFSRSFLFLKKIFIEETVKKERNVPLSKKESQEIQKENRRRGEARAILFGPLYSLKEYAIPSLEWTFKVFELLDQQELYISGKAGMGKTHVAFNIYKDRIKSQRLPAIFVFGKDLKTPQPLKQQLKEILDIRPDWSFENFLGALEISARTQKAKIPIIIDGLNESTYWNSVWSNDLERLILQIKVKYLHLVVITTYRTSYEDQLFPNNYFSDENHSNWYKKKVYVRGFENLTWKHIQKYFDFYKIKLTHSSDAIGEFRVPIYLKIFCKTKNPNRKKVVKVSFQKEDLFEVFDEYIKQSNRNITSSLRKLDSRYNANFTKGKLSKLAGYIWINNSRGMLRSENLFEDEELRIFEGENLLIFRDVNKETNKEEIQFTYDLLAGYMISKHLIEKYKENYPLLKIQSDNLLIKLLKALLDFKISKNGWKLLEGFVIKVNQKYGGKNSLLRFVNSREFREKLLNSKTQHPLFNDILRTISILLIKEKSLFLFDVLKDKRVKRYSIESLFEIKLKYIKDNENLVKDFLKKEFYHFQTRYFLLSLAENVEFAISHPLNFDFWSELINTLTMVDRDLSWSEYIRIGRSWRGHSYFSDFTKSFEEACRRKKVLSKRIHIAAKKVMWILTTNIRKLRDEATKGLYCYARRYPEEFFQLLKYSLEINDPNVPERILATCYGLAMARQNDFEDNSYKEEWLPKYGKFLFNNIFAEDAKYTTTHILARDYAKRTIDIALLHHPDLLNDTEKKQITYPLKTYPHRKWGASEDKDKGLYRGGNAPINMDFENDTIGGLIKNRRNYDSEHSEYQKILSNIYWRIYDLGYSLKNFGEIDKQIASENWNYSLQDKTGKTDHYGKKYSRIAFYEMAGYRSDLGLLKGWADEDEFRTPEADIDPSFPNELKKYDLVKVFGDDNFLGDETKLADIWYNTDSDLITDKYIQIKSKFSGKQEYEWIVLKGIIFKKNKEDQTRDVYIWINAIIVSAEDYKKIKEVTKNYTDYTFGSIDTIEHYYLFEGEISWCDLMPNDYSENLAIQYNYRNIIKMKNKKTLGTAEQETYNITSEDITYNKKENDSLVVKAERTTFRNAWESYHSDIIPAGEIITPSRSICENLNLFLKPQSSNLYNKNGDIIATSFKCGEGFYQTSYFSYIRKEYLEKHLENKNKRIIFFQHAEKRYFSKGIKDLSSGKRSGKFKYENYYKIIFL